MHNEDNVRTANASFTHHFDNEVRYGGGFNKRAMNQFERGKQGNWLYTYDNKSNVPVVLEYTDYMTCGLVSPTDGSKDCDKPLMRVRPSTRRRRRPLRSPTGPTRATPVLRPSTAARHSTSPPSPPTST